MLRLWRSLSIAVRVTVVYVAVGLAWIFLSDRFVAQLPGIIADQINQYQNLKGSFFVLATGALLLLYVARKEREIKDSEQRYRLLAENATDLVFRYRYAAPRGFEYISPSCMVMVGYTPEEHYSDPDLIFKIAHPEDRHILEEQAAGIPLPDPLVIRWIHKNGDTVWTELRHTRIYGDTGELVSLVGISRDITARKRVELELQESREYLASLVASAPVAIITLTEEGDIRTWNRSAEQLLGWKESEVVGKKFPKQSRETLAILVDAPLRGERRSLVSHSLRTKGDAEVVVEAAVTPLFDGSSKVTGAVVMVLDVTERVMAEKKTRLLEEELRQAQKMEAIGRLAGGVAHDFNNKLAVIMSTTEMLMATLEEGSPIYEDLVHIDDAAAHSADLTRQLLAFSRKQVIRPARINLNNVLKEQQKMLSRLIGEDIQIKLKLEDELWDSYIDPGQVDQILTNLVVNARDAIPGVGSITIETDNVEIDEEFSRPDLPVEQGDYVALTVADSGTGMSADVIEHIFEPFFTTKNQEQGTGLGLSTIYGIVKQNDGVIHVYSEPGLGSTFKVFLPRYEGAEAQPSTPKLSNDLMGKETVLVVEDEAGILALTKRFLDSLGYTVLTAHAPLEALRIVLEHSGEIDLLLSDVVMPEMNGRQLEEKIREMMPGISCLFMSGYTADVIAQRGVLDDRVEFISKPFTMTTLASKVRTVLDKR